MTSHNSLVVRNTFTKARDLKHASCETAAQNNLSILRGRPILGREQSNVLAISARVNFWSALLAMISCS